MQELLQLMQMLRAQCPWDKAQTPQSLTPYAIEEAYEVEAAVRQGDIAHIKEELGDLLLQVVFQAQMYAEQNAFDFQDVVDTLKAKLIRRHPHVFDEHFKDLDEQQVKALWQTIKQQEREQKGQTFVSRLEHIKAGSAVMQAQQLQEYAAKLNFDWADVDGAMQKFQEEYQELQQAIESEKPQHIQEELGDCLFSIINIGRKLNQNNEQALLATVHKFRRRFAYIEQQVQAQGNAIEDCSLAQLDALWNEAKQHEKDIL